ncbi:16S rRNA (adenine(1518)-N(6)/adenine(1519)-N(6))-dimethyltransferase RsmA [Leadbetterella sp. DM7]|uniref:16S rRNA (adenine(1518)-N(6)/adenine(1519)-N(6))- dimethyltransferase RsmA n=1 Tax=Leadbetterella sp. DM7 TaxID=3235085 RepID=UPI00349E8F5D
MEKVRAKKHLGQHFLKDLSAAQKITGLYRSTGPVLEIGPGMGVLTQYLVERKDLELFLVEIDRESVAYLQKHYGFTDKNLFDADFLEVDLNRVLGLTPDDKFGIIGNFPYNISSQIFFKVLDYKDQVQEVVGMVQKEVGQRIASPPGNKDYGILSVLLQAYYDIEYAFTVPPGAFDPPPKVDSGVIRLVRNYDKVLGCDFKKFKLVVKTAFNQRRKMLSNALKPIAAQAEFPYENKRAEQLDYTQFVEITKAIFE